MMRASIFNHVQVKVSNLAKSRRFYDAIMKVLGYDVVLAIRDVVVGYGTNTHDMFEIRQANAGRARLSQSVHIAFNALDKEGVDIFYRTALEHGAICHGKPGFRPDYEAGYYAAFVIDPDGHNIEAVYACQPKT